MANTRRQGLTTEGVMKALAMARDGERVLYVCCRVGSARRAKGIAEQLSARDGDPHETRLRIDFRGGGRLSFVANNVPLDKVDPKARIVFDHAALTRADPFLQHEWQVFAEKANWDRWDN